MRRTLVVLLLAFVPALVAAGVLAQGSNDVKPVPPSPGTPGEGVKNPHPNSLPEYREREKRLPEIPLEPAASPAAPGVRFGHVDVFLDSAGQSLAAYQCEITATAGDVALVGIEGGEHAAFNVPPYYDPKALGQKRIILGAFNTGTDLPRGRTRVARLMVQISGDARPAFDAKVQVAASPDGKPTPATISVSGPDSEGAER